jgi:predicted anti-sigma-YlaC factor YlaD
MSDHVSEWLNAYHDGELRGNRLHHVEEHVAECKLCQAELESLEGLSNVLHEVPVPEFVPVEKFATQVNLRLPHKQTQVVGKQIVEVGWWMIPVGLVGAWIFVTTSAILGDVLSTASHFGLLSGISSWISAGPLNDVYLSASLGQAGVLNGNSLSWAEATETLTRISLPQIILQISIAVLYLSWLAIWWARRTRQEHGPLLES